MNKEIAIAILRWAARVLTIIPLFAVVFITLEDFPKFYPLSVPFPLIISPISLYLGVLFLLLAWRWVLLGAISIVCFIMAYLVVVFWMGLFPNAIFLCCLPGVLYLICYVLMRSRFP